MPADRTDEAAMPAGRSAVEEHDDYGGIGLEEFELRIRADNDTRYGELIRNAKWEQVGE
jgi:hypothetical protein